MYMQTVISLGKYLFAIPLFIFGLMHLMSADQMASMAPGGAFMVYFTGLCLLAGSVSVMMGKYDKLASVLIALLLLLFLIPHVQGMMNATDEGTKAMQMINILKNISMAGGALAYAALAKDGRYVS